MPPPTPTRRPATELTLTRSATRRGSCWGAARRWGRAACATYSSPWRLSAIMRSHSCTGASTISPSSITPALLTTMSSRPSSCAVRSTAPTACSRSVTSASMARPPISALSASRRCLRRAATATVAPCSARARAVASPMPLLAPVTSATVPCSAVVMARGLPQDDARTRDALRVHPVEPGLEGHFARRGVDPVLEQVRAHPDDAVVVVAPEEAVQALDAAHAEELRRRVVDDAVERAGVTERGMDRLAHAGVGGEPQRGAQLVHRVRRAGGV